MDPVRLSNCTVKITREDLKGKFQDRIGSFQIINSSRDEATGTQEHIDFAHLPLSNWDKSLSVLPQGFQEHKQRIVCVSIILNKHPELYNEDLARSILQDGSPEKLQTKRRQSSGWRSVLLSLLPGGNATSVDVDIKTEVTNHCNLVTDSIFLSHLDHYVKEAPLVEPATCRALDATYDYLSRVLNKTFASLMSTVLKKRQEAVKTQINEELARAEQEDFHQSTDVFIEEVNSISDNTTNPFVRFSFPFFYFKLVVTTVFTEHQSLYWKSWRTSHTIHETVRCILSTS